MRNVLALACALTLGACILTQSAAARQARPGGGVKVCSLLPKAEVKTLIGGGPLFDRIPPEEETVGVEGASCNYADVTVQVLRFNRTTMDTVKNRARLETLSGVGDEAYLYDNPAGYAEIYVKVGDRLLTLQRNLNPGQTVTSVRAGVLALANAYIGKLR
jgi:hypothetical protein